MLPLSQSMYSPTDEQYNGQGDAEDSTAKKIQSFISLQYNQLYRQRSHNNSEFDEQNPLLPHTIKDDGGNEDDRAQRSAPMVRIAFTVLALVFVMLAVMQIQHQHELIKIENAVKDKIESQNRVLPSLQPSISGYSSSFDENEKRDGDDSSVQSEALPVNSSEGVSPEPENVQPKEYTMKEFKSVLTLDPIERGCVAFYTRYPSKDSIIQPAVGSSPSDSDSPVALPINSTASVSLSAPTTSEAVIPSGSNDPNPNTAVYPTEKLVCLKNFETEFVFSQDTIQQIGLNDGMYRGTDGELSIGYVHTAKNTYLTFYTGGDNRGKLLLVPPERELDLFSGIKTSGKDVLWSYAWKSFSITFGNAIISEIDIQESSTTPSMCCMLYGANPELFEHTSGVMICADKKQAPSFRFYNQAFTSRGYNLEKYDQGVSYIQCGEDVYLLAFPTPDTSGEGIFLRKGESLDLYRSNRPMDNKLQSFALYYWKPKEGDINGNNFRKAAAASGEGSISGSDGSGSDGVITIGGSDAADDSPSSTDSAAPPTASSSPSVDPSGDSSGISAVGDVSSETPEVPAIAGEEEVAGADSNGSDQTVSDVSEDGDSTDSNDEEDGDGDGQDDDADEEDGKNNRDGSDDADSAVGDVEDEVE